MATGGSQVDDARGVSKVPKAAVDDGWGPRSSKPATNGGATKDAWGSSSEGNSNDAWGDSGSGGGGAWSSSASTSFGGGGGSKVSSGGGGHRGGGGGGIKLRGTAGRWIDKGFGFIKPDDGSEVCMQEREIGEREREEGERW